MLRRRTGREGFALQLLAGRATFLAALFLQQAVDEGQKLLRRKRFFKIVRSP
jgi:hypothetical protein